MGADLNPDERRVARRAFSRYHAALQVNNDARVVWLGAVIYALAIRQVMAASPPYGGPVAALKVVGLALSVLWPQILRVLAPEFLLRWRDQIFAVHWWLHHVVGYRVLDSAGVNFRKNLASQSPVLFYISFLLTRPTLWFCGNMLVYRMKAPLFAVIQPVLLAMNWADERAACAASSREYPEITQAAFGRVAAALRTVMQSTPGAGDADGPLMACCKVHAFTSVMVGFLLPGAVIWWLETQTRRDFARVDPELLTWPGGPSAREIGAVQAKLRRKWKRRGDYYYSGWSGRVVGVGFVVAAIVWQLLDTMGGWGCHGDADVA